MHSLTENVASMDKGDCEAMSAEFASQPWFVDACGISLAHRPRLFLGELRPGFRPRSKGKGFAAWEDDQQDTAFWGKGKGKGKSKKGKKGMMKGKDSFKGMPSWKGKGKGDAKNKGGNNPFMSQPPQANVAQAATSSASQAPEKTRNSPCRRKLGL